MILSGGCMKMIAQLQVVDWHGNGPAPESEAHASHQPTRHHLGDVDSPCANRNSNLVLDPCSKDTPWNGLCWHGGSISRCWQRGGGDDDDERNGDG